MRYNPLAWTVGWVLVGLGGCPGMPVEGVPVGTLEVAVTAVPTEVEAGEDHGVDRCAVVVDGLVVDGEGPSGAESVVVVGDRTVTLLPPAPTAPIVVSLERGEHTDVGLTLDLGTPGAPAIDATGWIDERPVHVLVPTLTLTFSEVYLHVADDVIHARIGFDPAAWFEELEIEDDDDDDEPLVIDEDAGPVYDALLALVRGTTRLTIGPESGGESDE